jgi:glycosyltransferase involved in cell wall biosynthesis
MILNIFFLNSVAETSWGGGEKWMLKAAEGLQKLGHHIIFGGRENSIFLERCKAAGFPTYPLFISGDFNPRTISRLRQIFIRHNINVAIPNFNKDVRLVSLAGKLSTRPIVVARSGLPILRNNWIYRATYRMLVDGIITNTEAIKARYLSFGWLDEGFIRVIYNGVDIKPIPQIDAVQVRQKYALPAEGPIVGIFGRLVPQKQHDKFLAVAQNIVSKRPDTSFLIVGDGPLKEEIEQQIAQMNLQERVCMTGFQEDPTELYLICNVVLLTSENEGMPNVLMEAMHYARPVIAFSVGGVPELIDSPVSGIIVPPNDITEMSSAALQLLQNPQKAESIGRAARERIINNFSVAHMAKQVESYLQSLLLQKRRNSLKK